MFRLSFLKSLKLSKIKVGINRCCPHKFEYILSNRYIFMLEPLDYSRFYIPSNIVHHFFVTFPVFFFINCKKRSHDKE